MKIYFNISISKDLIFNILGFQNQKVSKITEDWIRFIIKEQKQQEYTSALQHCLPTYLVGTLDPNQKPNSFFLRELHKPSIFNEPHCSI